MMDLEKTKNLIKKQLDLMGANYFNITKIKKDENGITKLDIAYKLKNEKGEDSLTKDFILSNKIIKDLIKNNEKNSNEVYIKIDEKLDQVYNIVIDDVKEENLKEVLTNIKPTFILFSSTNNYQVVIKTDKTKYTKKEANDLTMRLNLKYGDKHFKGSNHIFRLAGFHNKKACNKNEFVDFVKFDSKVEDNKRYFEELLKITVEKREEKKKLNENKSKSYYSDITEEEFNSFDFEILNEKKLDLALRIIQYQEENCQKIFKNYYDSSAVKFRIARDLLSKGLTMGETLTALMTFTNASEKHDEKWGKRTIIKAKLDLNK